MEYITITEFPGYEINKLGQVRSKKTNKILSQSISTKGYYQINIAHKCRRTHRLLAETFIPNPDNLETVNHKDGNKLNNDLPNLEWMSRADNVKHSRIELGITPIPYSKSNNPNHLLGRTGDSSNRGKCISAELEDGTVKIYGSARMAALDLFGDVKKFSQIRQSIKRKSALYEGIKFKDHDKPNQT